MSCNNIEFKLPLQRVLIVEDELVTANVLKKTIEKIHEDVGYGKPECKKTRSVKETKDLLKESWSMILLDGELADGDITELFLIIKSSMNKDKCVCIAASEKWLNIAKKHDIHMRPMLKPFLFSHVKGLFTN